MLINIGAVHPSTHGVLRILGILNGELIQWLNVEIGLLHRGTEKLVELNYFNNSIGYFDRLDYVSIVSQELLFVHALEKLFNIYSVLYDSLIRTLIVECYRILNHLLAITTHIIDLGLFSTLLWMFEFREIIFNLFESLTGSRFHLTFPYLSRLRFDLTIISTEPSSIIIPNLNRKSTELPNLVSHNNTRSFRLHKIGIINKNISLFYGLSGLLGRSLGLNIDARLLNYDVYNSINWNSFVSYNGDCLDRYILRFNEIIESSKIIYLLLFKILNIKDFGYNWSSKSLNDFQMEFIIYEFLFNFNLFYSLFNYCCTCIESSKGIYTLFISSIPYFVINIISSDFLMINNINKFCKNISLADLIACLGSLDFVLGSVDLHY